MYILGIDVGGTFTDAFAADEMGQTWSAKAPSTPPNFSLGVIDAIDELSSQVGLPTKAFLPQVTHLCHGTTTTLNALITGNVSRVGWITTKGHRDSIYIMNLEGRYAGLRPDQIQDILGTRKPPPLIPKRLAKEVSERVDYKGSVIVTLNEEEVQDAVSDLLAEGVTAIAVSLLWSFLNPSHERRIREIIEDMAPDMYVGLSSEISPRIREYSRNVTTIMSTQVGPVLKNYIQPLNQQIQSFGLGSELLVMQGSGGLISAPESPRYAISTIGSVLTGGVVGATSLAKQLGHKNVITTDMGGTTFLVGLVVDGSPVFTTTTILNQFTISVPMMRVDSIGSGGGAIARVDSSQHIHVGPDSAGALPGPACYGQGGRHPTVTDADLILGILDPHFFLGGRKPLYPALAREALSDQIGGPLGLSAEEAAAAIYAIQNAQTADLLRKNVIETGLDPREFVIYAFGGAGPVHCGGYGADLGVEAIVVPMGQTASAFSAYGLAASDIVLNAELSHPSNYPVAAATINQIFQQLEDDLNKRIQTQRIAFERVSFRREIDMRYTMQIAEVTTPVTMTGLLQDPDVDAIVNAFEDRYVSLFGQGTGFREAGIQFITYRVYATGYLPVKPRLADSPHCTSSPESAIKGRRPVLLDPKWGWQDTPIYDYRLLEHGHMLQGPAVVEATTTTIVIEPEMVGIVDQYRNIVMRLR